MWDWEEGRWIDLSILSKLGDEYSVFVSTFPNIRHFISNWKMPSLSTLSDLVAKEKDKLFQMGDIRISNLWYLIKMLRFLVWLWSIQLSILVILISLYICSLGSSNKHILVLGRYDDPHLDKLFMLVYERLNECIEGWNFPIWNCDIPSMECGKKD